MLKLLFLLPVLCSCGQIGPLYLPEAPPPIHTQKQPPPPAEVQKTVPKAATSTQNQ